MEPTSDTLTAGLTVLQTGLTALIGGLIGGLVTVMAQRLSWKRSEAHAARLLLPDLPTWIYATVPQGYTKMRVAIGQVRVRATAAGVDRWFVDQVEQAAMKCYRESQQNLDYEDAPGFVLTETSDVLVEAIDRLDFALSRVDQLFRPNLKPPKLAIAES